MHAATLLRIDRPIPTQWRVWIITRPSIVALVSCCCDDGLKAASHLLDKLRSNKFQAIDDPADSACSRAYQTKLGMFDHFSKVDRKRWERFAFGMAGCETIKAFTEDVYAFGKLPSNATIVDVGGGLGQVSLRIVEKILGLSFTVQGQARVIEIATSGGIEEEVRDRIAFQAHSSFDEQPVNGADVYLFRFILHGHPDRYGTTIFSTALVKTFLPLTLILLALALRSCLAKSKPWIPKNGGS